MLIKFREVSISSILLPPLQSVFKFRHYLYGVLYSNLSPSIQDLFQNPKLHLVVTSLYSFYDLEESQAFLVLPDTDIFEEYGSVIL